MSHTPRIPWELPGCGGEERGLVRAGLGGAAVPRLFWDGLDRFSKGKLHQVVPGEVQVGC